jgi:dihydroxyacetone kinase-like protein
MQKIINDPNNFVDEVLDGILLAYPDQLRVGSNNERSVVRADAPGNRVGIVTGGGSGHLPVFLGYVGKGLCSGVAVGNVFSSPSSVQILDTTRAVNSGRGVLYLFGNYGGDVLNFELAGDLADAEGIVTTTVLIADDVLSAATPNKDTRRGVAGMVFAFKCAGAAAERGDDLASVTRIAQKAVAATRSVGVGLSPTILPAAGKPTFELPHGMMEIGIGIHGEPGTHRGPLETADQIAERLVEALIADRDTTSIPEIALIVNGLGATPLEELYLLFRKAHQIFSSHGIVVKRVLVGEYATSLEMAGASISIMDLDEELVELFDAPASSPFFSQK